MGPLGSPDVAPTTMRPQHSRLPRNFGGGAEPSGYREVGASNAGHMEPSTG